MPQNLDVGCEHFLLILWLEVHHIGRPLRCHVGKLHSVRCVLPGNKADHFLLILDSVSPASFSEYAQSRRVPARDLRLQIVLSSCSAPIFCLCCPVNHMKDI